MEFLMDPMWNSFLCQDKNREVDLKNENIENPDPIIMRVFFCLFFKSTLPISMSPK